MVQGLEVQRRRRLNLVWALELLELLAAVFHQVRWQAGVGDVAMIFLVIQFDLTHLPTFFASTLSEYLSNIFYA
jgi:hypothetical protein